MIEHSEDIKELAEALIEARSNMDAIAKANTNPHFNSKFAGLPDLIEGTNQQLLEQDLFITQHPCTEFHPGDAQSAPVCLIGCETMLIHASSGQWLKSRLLLPAKGLDPQKGGSAITYAKRYTIEAVLNIPTKDDDGNGAMPAPAKPRKQEEPAVTMGPTDIKSFINNSINAKVVQDIYDNHVKDNNSLTDAAKAELKQLVTDKYNELQGA